MPRSRIQLLRKIYRNNRVGDISTVLMAKPNFQFEKRRKELEKKRKKDEKKQQKLDNKNSPLKSGLSDQPQEVE